MNLENIENVQKTLRRVLSTSTWWNYVQDDVKFKIEDFIVHIDVQGPSFRDAFVAMFKYEHVKRMLSENACKHDKPGVFGRSLSEETYQCSVNAVKFLLNLDEWFMPNDADVSACMQICHSIDMFEKLDLFDPPLNHKALVLPKNPTE